LKKLSIAMTVAMVSTSAYAQLGLGGNAGATMSQGSGQSGPISSTAAGNAGSGDKGAGGNGGAGGSFDEWDLDRNGVLSVEEVRLAGFTQADFLKMDVDQNGRVTRQEFMVAQITPSAKPR